MYAALVSGEMQLAGLLDQISEACHLLPISRKQLAKGADAQSFCANLIDGHAPVWIHERSQCFAY